MPGQPMQLPWEQPGWLQHVTRWIEARTAEHGRTVTGPLELVHQRPWSAFARVLTDQGIVHFKAPSPMFKYEAALTERLASLRPDCMVPLLGVHYNHGWILSADAGTTLRQITQSPAQLSHWDQLLPLYSELQIELIEHGPALLARGVPDRRLEHMPRLYTQLLEDTDSIGVGQAAGLSAAEYKRLQAGQARFTAQCEQLASFNLPQTITHEEVHENNVLFGGGRYIFTDWSDCSISHPFFTMLVTLRSVAHWLKLDESGPELARVRDAYLEPWTRFASRVTLLTALDLAYRLGMVNRALSWHQALSRLSAEQTAPYADSVYGWLQDFLEAEAAARAAHV